MNKIVAVDDNAVKTLARSMGTTVGIVGKCTDLGLTLEQTEGLGYCCRVHGLKLGRAVFVVMNIKAELDVPPQEAASLAELAMEGLTLGLSLPKMVAILRDSRGDYDISHEMMEEAVVAVEKESQRFSGFNKGNGRRKTARHRGDAPPVDTSGGIHDIRRYPQ